LNYTSDALKGEPSRLNEYNHLGKRIAFAAIGDLVPSDGLVEVIQFSANAAEGIVP
jgi:hypothetical protein